MEKQIRVKNLQKKFPLKISLIKTTIHRILKSLKIENTELSVVFTTDVHIRSLNRQYLKKNHATDVLAFDMSPSARSTKKKLCGEIIISIETARRNAKHYQFKIIDEIRLYLIHGILHLLGYDDHSFRDKREMEWKQQKLLQEIKT